MDSNWNDQRNEDWAAVGDKSSSRWDGGYGSSEGRQFEHGDGRRADDWRTEGSRHTSPPGNPYGTRRGEHSGYGFGYSTGNDFSGQEPVRGRTSHSENRRDYRGYDEEDYPRYRERYRRSEYPETYRSAMSGYMSEHVGSDSGRSDYNQDQDSGNLYGNTYGPPRGYASQRAHGHMSEDDYDRGTPFSGENRYYGQPAGREHIVEGRHRGKGPRNYRRADDRILEDINDWLTDDPRVDASEVNVKVENSEVILTGTVDDRRAKRRAEDIAESVSGVTHVENRLRVEPPASTNPGLIVTPY